MSIIQGSQFYVPMKFKQDSTYFTPDNCTDIKVVYGGNEVTRLGGGLTWDSDNSYWKLWLTQAQSLRLQAGEEKLQIQAEIKIGQNIFPTALVLEDVGKNIIRREFE